MQECISISRVSGKHRSPHTWIILVGVWLAIPMAFAQTPLTAAPTQDLAPPTPAGASPQEAPDPSQQGQVQGQPNPGSTEAPSPAPKVERDDYSGTPYTQYGEFHEANEEEETIRFLQFGRLFGVSLGTGFEFVDGYRGALWSGGFPVVDFKVHYWFDFNIAMDLGVYTAYQYYNTTAGNLGHTDVNLVHVGVDVKYYFPVRNLSAALSFANPYILLGVGSYTKTEISNQAGTNTQDTELGVAGGLGLEFVISPKKTYFSLEGKINVVTFKDTYYTTFSTVGLPNLTGNFYTVTGSILFTW